MDSQEKQVDTDTSKPLDIEVETNSVCERKKSASDTNVLCCQKSEIMDQLGCANDNAQTLYDEDNTQLITNDVCVNEIEECESEGNVCTSNLIEPASTSKLIISDEAKDSLPNDLASEMETEEMKQANSPEKSDDTVIINEIEEKSKSELEDNRVIERSCSQASTQDIRSLGEIVPHSPDDLFASQSLGEETECQTQNSFMESEDFIPSSMSQNLKDVSETDGSTDSVLTTRKRKLEEIDKVHSETKVPKMQLLASTSGENNNEQSKKNEEDCSLNKETVVVNDMVKTDSISSTSSLNRDNSKQSHEEQAIFKKPIISPKGKDNEILLESLQQIDGSKIGRKSVEIVFSSMEDSAYIERGPNLSSVPEENGEDCFEESGSENFHLQISLSPSQATQSFSEVDVSKDDGMDANMSPMKRKYEISSNGHSDINTSYSEENDSSLVNEVSTDDIQTRSDSGVVHERSVLIVSPEAVEKSREDTVVHSSTSNKTEKQSDCDGADEIFVLHEKRSSNTDSESLKHSMMNGSLHERNECASGKIRIKHDANGLDKVENVSNNEVAKHHQLLNVPMVDRSTPDLPVLLPNKGKFQSTPLDTCGLTPASVSFSSLSRTSLSTDRLKDHEQNVAVQLREIDCLFNIKGRVQFNEESHQVQSIELYQCLEVDDYFPNNINQRENSSGYVGDESKNSSPSSVSSVGPFHLKSNAYRYSTSSSSTASSGHSGLGRFASSEVHFTAPIKPAPIRSYKGRNFHYSSEFVRDIFDLVEKKINSDDDPKLPTTSTLPTTVPTATNSNCPIETSGNTNETHEKKMVSVECVAETPKSSKKSTRGLRNVRSASRNLVSKIQEVEEEEIPPTSQQPVEKDSTEIVGSNKKPRKTPLRSSKRAANSVPMSPAVTEENKNSTSVSANRSRRNRNEMIVNEKTENGSKEPSNVWDNAGRCSKLVPGVLVFARWTDKKYYPGKIKEKMKDGRWIIEFDDKTVRPSKEEFIAPINILPKGQIVFANEEEEDEQGIIVEFKVVNNEVQYGVELDSGRKSFYPRSKLFMSEDQARLLQENLDPKSPTTSSPALTTVTCDNIVHHKRPRSNRVLFGAAESPSVSGLLKTPKRSGKIDSSYDTSCSSSMSDTNDKGPPLVLEEVSGVEPEAPSYFSESLPIPSGRGKGPGRIKSKTRTPRKNPSNRSFNDNQECNQLHEQLGPIPEEGSKIFTGKCFLLTQSVVRSIDNVKNSSSSKSNKKSSLSGGSEPELTSSTTDSDKDVSRCKIPFVKHHLKKQIEAGGGIVFEHFEDLPEDQYQNTFLVTDRPCLTAKYILCLASGIRIIQHQWIIQEAKGFSRPSSSARIQVGWDLEGQRYVPLEASVRTRKQKPLNRKKVGLVNESQTFVKFWGRILELMGASVRHINPDKDREFSGVDVIVTDNSCPPEVQERAREWTIPLVSPTWVTQSLINWRIRSYTGHALYRYDYCVSE